MLDISKIKLDTFKVKMGDGTMLSLHQPKIKLVKKFIAVGSEIEEAESPELVIDSIVSVVAEILSQNKEGKKISNEYVEEMFSYEDLYTFFGEYANWLGKTKENPN